MQRGPTEGRKEGGRERREWGRYGGRVRERDVTEFTLRTRGIMGLRRWAGNAGSHSLALRTCSRTSGDPLPCSRPDSCAVVSPPVVRRHVQHVAQKGHDVGGGEAVARHGGRVPCCCRCCMHRLPAVRHKLHVPNRGQRTAALEAGIATSRSAPSCSATPPACSPSHPPLFHRLAPTPFHPVRIAGAQEHPLRCSSPTVSLPSICATLELPVSHITSPLTLTPIPSAPAANPLPLPLYVCQGGPRRQAQELSVQEKGTVGRGEGEKKSAAYVGELLVSVEVWNGAAV